jgi:heme oxygenase
MILENIKIQTLENHKLLEKSQLMLPIMNGTLVLKNYLRILNIFYGYFSPLERTIEKFKDMETYLPDFHTRRKSDLLLADLNLLTQLPNISVCKDLPQISSLSQAFGCLYVMEGSTLGGRVISGIVNDRLNINASTGASFFNGYGADTGNKWKKFQEALSAYSNDNQKEEEIIAAANDTFIKFKDWIENRS